MSRIIFGFIGPAGSGKSTQAKFLAQTLSCRYLSVGEELRKIKDPALEKILNDGELVPDHFVVEIIEAKLKDLGESEFLVLDGFFRSASEVGMLWAKRLELKFSIGAVIDLSVSDKVVLERLEKRAREDDIEEAIKERLEIFKEERAEIIAFLKKSKIKLISVDGEPEIDVVQDEILEGLEEFLSKN